MSSGTHPVFMLSRNLTMVLPAFSWPSPLPPGRGGIADGHQGYLKYFAQTISPSGSTGICPLMIGTLLRFFDWLDGSRGPGSAAAASIDIEGIDGATTSAGALPSSAAAIVWSLAAVATTASSVVLPAAESSPADPSSSPESPLLSSPLLLCIVLLCCFLSSSTLAFRSALSN